MSLISRWFSRLCSTLSTAIVARARHQHDGVAAFGLKLFWINPSISTPAAVALFDVPKNINKTVFIVAILTAFFTTFSQAETPEGSLNNPGLALFVTTEDQMALEKKQSALLAPDSGFSSDERKPLKSYRQPEIADNASDPIRYDGIMMKGDQVLGMWFDGISVADIENYTSADSSAISAGGQLQLVKGISAATLYPGDYFSATSVTVVGPVLPVKEESTDQNFKVSPNVMDTNEIDTSEADIGEMGMDDSDTNDTVSGKSDVAGPDKDGLDKESSEQVTSKPDESN